jgi:PIN domain nuclease of toxin-antitoxin system
MTVLLDTHAWIQRACGVRMPRLVDRVLREEADSLALSDISLWEAAKLVELGRLKLSVSVQEFFRSALTTELTVLSITPAIAARACTLEAAGFHKDPADQIIVATALVHGLRLVSDDARIQRWRGVPMLWKTPRG